MAKRGASSDINHDNWDEPIEAEEAGSFKVANQDTLQKRVIKIAKRRVKPSDSENTDESKRLFASFTGFKSTAFKPNSTGSSTSFGFLGATSVASSVTPTVNGALASPAVKAEVNPQQKYLNNLQQLNRSVSDWIKTHVDSNPACILTPVFKDYEKHLKQIQAERDDSDKTVSTSVSSSAGSLAPFSFVSSSTSESNKFTINIPTTTDGSKKTFTFSDTNLNTPVESDKPSPLLFGLGKDSGKSPLLQGDSGNKSHAPSIFSSFSSSTTGSSLLTKPDPAALMVNPFTSAVGKEETKSQVKPFSLSNGSPAPTSSTNKDEGEEEESEEPPKVEFTPVQEEGAVFSTRCKVFVKKDNNYKDRGVGTLFIKKVGEDKHQLLVRAETVLGNILVNVLLSSAIPTQRMGKNNVMLVCLPTPQDPPPPTTVLLRVKTAAEADDLLSTIDQYKH